MDAPISRYRKWKCRKWLAGRLEMGWRDETDVDVNPWMRWGYNIYTHNMWYIIFKCPHRILIEIRVDTFTHTQIYIYNIIYMSSMYAFIQLHQRWMGWMAANKLLSMALVLREMTLARIAGHDSTELQAGY